MFVMNNDHSLLVIKTEKEYIHQFRYGHVRPSVHNRVNLLWDYDTEIQSSLCDSHFEPFANLGDEVFDYVYKVVGHVFQVL